VTRTLPFDSATLRKALGHVPTSVCIVSTSDSGGPIGMTVGTFTSISLEPPLVGFFADSGSMTFHRVRTAEHFTVSVLDDTQDEVCRAFSGEAGDRFAEVSLVPGRHPAPRIAGALGWFDCAVDTIVNVGDHHLVVGRVLAFDVSAVPRGPLVFFRGILCQLDPTVPSRGIW